MLTIVDDHSRATWSYFLPTKSQSFSVLTIFFCMVCTQLHTPVHVVRSDNGSEFTHSSPSLPIMVFYTSVVVFIPLNKMEWCAT